MIQPGQNRGYCHTGLTAVVLVLAVLVLVAAPNVFRAQGAHRYQGILKNLRAIDNQKQLWAATWKKADQEIPTPNNLAPYFPGGVFPASVMGETYHLNSVGARPTATVPSRLRTRELTIEAGGTVTLPDTLAAP